MKQGQTVSGSGVSMVVGLMTSVIGSGVKVASGATLRRVWD